MKFGTAMRAGSAIGVMAGAAVAHSVQVALFDCTIAIVLSLWEIAARITEKEKP